MKATLTFLFSALTLNCFGQFVPNGFPVNLWLRVSGGTNGNNISNSNYWNSITVGGMAGGGWVTNQEDRAFVSITEAKTFPRLLNVGSLNYLDSANNLAITVNLASNVSSMIYNFPVASQPSEILVVMQIKFGTRHGAFNVFDIMDINNGSRALIPQYWENQPTGHWSMFAHNANSLGHGFSDWDLSKWYWLIMFCDDANGIGTIALIDTVTGTVAIDGHGNPCLDTIVEPNSSSAYVSIGRGDVHNNVIGGIDQGPSGTPSDPLEIKNYAVAWGANAQKGWSYFEPIILNATSAHVGTVTH